MAAMQSPVAETQLLKPSPKDENQWPEFSLRDVEVYCTDDHDRASAVDIWRAEPNQPVTVEGTLARLSKTLQKHYRNASSIPAEAQRVKIADCTYWSYGQYDNGQIAFWAAGQAGWFELRPAKQYSARHKLMKQSIELLYFAADFYRERLQKHGSSAAKRKAALQQLSLETLFAEYAAEAKHRCSPGPNAARNRFLKHAEVLVTLMRRGKEATGWKWQDTALFEYLDFKLKPAPDTPSRAADSSEDAMSVSTSSTGRPKVSGKSRSGLRPKLTPSKGVQRARTSSSTRASDDDIEMLDADALSPSRQAKRKQELPESPSRRSGRLSKRLATVSDSKTPAASPSVLSSSQEDDRQFVALPIRPDYRAGDKKKSQTSSMKLISTPLPTYDPIPGTDTWRCPFDGCVTQYYGVTSQPGVSEMIRQHYAAHAVESQTQLDLIMREERPYLPVGNLVRHIRGLVAAENRRGNVSSAGMDAARGPKPIVQRY